MIVFILLFFALIGSGIAIYLAIGLTSSALFLVEGKSLAGLVQIIADHLNSLTLVAVPFFVIAATFMQRGGIADALIQASNTWVGHFRGGLALVCITTATIFSAISGSATATALALGVILVPAMLNNQYPRPFSMGVVSASGTLGILIPPSLGLIIYGLITDASIPKLFLAGVMPGLLQALLFGVWALYYAHREDIPKRPKSNWSKLVSESNKALPALLVPALVLGGIYSGAITITEAAALAAILSIVISILIYKQINYSDILPLIAEAIVRSASILFIVAVAAALGHWVIESGVPAQLAQFISSHQLSAWQFLLLMNLVMLMLGMFLEIVAVILITVPIVLPTLAALSISPIHYAIVVIVNMSLATLTPPVGLNLFVMQSVVKAPFSEVVRGVWPFIIILLLLLLLVTYLPILSLWLPSVVMG